MKTIDIVDATKSLADYAREGLPERLVSTDEGKPLVALVSVSEMDLETLTVSLSPVFRGIINRARERRRAEGGISHDEMVRRFGADGHPPPANSDTRTER